MNPPAARQQRLILLASANVDWHHRLARLAVALPGRGVGVMASRDPAHLAGLAGGAPVALVVQVRDGGQALPQPVRGIPGAERWLIQPDPRADREAAFTAGFHEVIAAGAGDRELSVRLERVCRPDGYTALADGIGGLARVHAAELAGPLHFMGLGQRAMQQELEILRPLFTDLHKAWFESNQALLERLRMILAVINLNESWNGLSQAVADFGDGLQHLRDSQHLLGLSACLEDPEMMRLSVWEMFSGCIAFVAGSCGAGIRFSNRLPPGYGGHLPAACFFTALLSLFSHLTAALAAQGSGRGDVAVGPVLSGTRQAVRILVGADAAEEGDWCPAFLPERLLFGRIGVGVDAYARPDGFALDLVLPEAGEEGAP
jgi:hypothetical protein